MFNTFEIGKLKETGLEEIAALVNCFTACQIKSIPSFPLIWLKVNR